MDYLKDKNDLFKARIKARKKLLSYKTKMYTKNTCENCYYFEPLSPSMNRCHLISLSIEKRSASISLTATCNLFNNENKEENLKKYPYIEFEDISCLEVAKFKREGII